RPRDVEIHYAGLHYGAFVFEVDFENFVHAREDQQDAAFAWYCPAGKSGAGAAADQRKVELTRNLDDSRDLFRGAHKCYKVRPVLIDAAVVFVERQVFGALEHIPFAKQFSQAVQCGRLRHIDLQFQPFQIIAEGTAQVVAPQRILDGRFQESQLIAGVVARSFEAIRVDRPAASQVPDRIGKLDLAARSRIDAL